MNSAEKIVLRRLKKVFVPANSGDPQLQFVASLAKNLQSIGFTFSPAVLKRLKSWSPEELLEFANSLLPTLLKMVGGDVEYKPMYPNFPQQVMDASDAELYVNAMLHYWGDWTGQRILPQYETDQRLAVELPKNLKILDLASDDEATKLCRSLISANTSLSKSDLSDLRSLLNFHRNDLTAVLPESISFKEIQSVVTGFLIDRAEEPVPFLSKYVRTATDVLRLATEMSDGDTSLAAPTKYKSFSRKQRRVILGLLNNISQPDEDLNRHRGKWIRLAERLHPGEYAKRFSDANESIRKLRNNEKPVTFNSTVESLIRDGDLLGAAKLLCRRPGEFARRLDHLLRDSGDDALEVLEQFGSVAVDVSTPVLLQLIAHFQMRATDRTARRLSDVAAEESLQFFEKAVQKLTQPLSKRKKVKPHLAMRTVFPKGQASKLVRIPLADALVPESIANRVVQMARAILSTRFAELPPLGKCFVSNELKKFAVPFSQRSASKSLRTLARGSRLSLPTGNVVRLFLWWKEGKVRDKKTGRVDLDLSATIFRDDWKYLNHISYTNLKEDKLGCCHSGDITSAPNGASEFVDLDLEKLRIRGARYVVCSIQSFTSHPFCDLPQCYVGWMTRNKPQSGEIFEPATVQDKIDLASDRRVSVPMVIDLKERSMIWADLALKSMPGYQVNIESNLRGLVHYGVGIESMNKPNLFELFSLHAQARGEIVGDASNAEQVFAVDDGVTPFDFELIASGYLS
jgi:hypothetical protein